MPSSQRLACWRKLLTACALTCLVLLVGLLVFFVMHLILSWQEITGKVLFFFLFILNYTVFKHFQGAAI